MSNRFVGIKLSPQKQLRLIEELGKFKIGYKHSQNQLKELHAELKLYKLALDDAVRWVSAPTMAKDYYKAPDKVQYFLKKASNNNDI